MPNILICDDERDIVNALKIYLSDSDYTFFEAYNGKEAVDICSAHEIHLVLLDLMMPIMDGIVATSKIREFSNVPIIMLTANAMAGAAFEYENIGFDGYLSKPILPAQLKDTIISLAKRK